MFLEGQETRTVVSKEDGVPIKESEPTRRDKSIYRREVKRLESSSW